MHGTLPRIPAMYACPECDETVASAGSLEIHEELFHGSPREMVLRDAVAGPAAVPQRPRSTTGWSVWAGLGVVVMCVVVLSGFVAAAMRSDDTDKPDAAVAAADDPAMAHAREQYVEFARVSNAEGDALQAEMAPVFASRSGPRLGDLVRRMGAHERATVERLRAIAFPASIQARAEVVMDDSARLADVLEQAGRATSCPAICLGLDAAEPILAVMAQHTSDLRLALGLPPDPES